MGVEELTIREAREVASMFPQPSPRVAENAPRELGLQIVVLDRGFVYVGNVTLTSDEVLISNARNIRRWGTTSGLGQLASDGPTANTLLDPCPLVRAPRRALNHLIACEVSKWSR